MLPHRILPRLMSFVQKILYLHIRSKNINSDLHELEQSDSKDPLPVFYVTRYRSLADALVIARECEKAEVKTPLKSCEKLKSSGIPIRHRFIPLTVSGMTLTHSKAPRYFSETLQKLIFRGIEDPSFDVNLVPTSVFWGRSPRIEGSFWQIFFSDSWVIPGFFRKFFMIILKGRQTHVQFSQPFQLQQLIANEKDPQRVIAKTHRVIRNRLRKQREAFIGPDLSHRRTLVKNLLEQPKVLQAIEREAKKNNTPTTTIHKKAFKIANEIAADYSHSVIRSMYLLLTWLWTKLYNGVEVQFGEKLQNLAAEHAIVYVPSHRSHVDYLLLSYVLYDRLGLVPPHIAAGINLNLPIIGPILRRGGAFFMRRSFRDNPLYSAIFTEYLHTVLDRGFSIEYFIEGGRSRTGKQLPPKPGMLGMTLKSYAASRKKPLVFVPVNFCYERLFEGKSYLGELRGQKKRKETLIQFFQSLKRIKENFGRVHVTFGEPLTAEEFLKDMDIYDKSQVLEFDHHKMKHLSLKLGETISERINQSAAAHPVALLSLVILSSPNRAISEHKLVRQLELLLLLQKSCPFSKHSPLTSMSPTEIIRYCIHMNYLNVHPHSFGDIYFFTEKQSNYLSYIYNNTVHIFAIPALIALYCHSYETISADDCAEKMYKLYTILRAELFLEKMSYEKFTHQASQHIEIFAQQNAIESLDSHNQKFRFIKRQDRLFSRLNLLSNLIKPSLERYAITLLSLEHSKGEKITAKSLETLSKTLAERFSTLYKSTPPDYYDGKSFQNIVQFLLKEAIITTNDEGLLIFNDQLSDQIIKLEKLLDSNLKESLLSAY